MGDSRIDVLGVRVSAINMESALGVVRRWVEEGDRQYVCVTGVHGVMESQKDPHLLEIHNRSGLTTPDGMPMVWAGKSAGADWMERVYGPDLMLNVLAEAASKGWSSFFYGGAPDVPDLLAERLSERFPDLVVAGMYSPPFRPLTPQETDDVVNMINDSAADLVWVGLSTPKQERWMAEMRPRLNAAVLFGVGAAFDFHAGKVDQAPGWMQRRGLEWLYRLVKEPRRLWKRYLTNNPRFVLSIARRRPFLVDDSAMPVPGQGRAGRRGRLVALVGPDGAGKTTFARALLAVVGDSGRYFHFRPPLRGPLASEADDTQPRPKYRGRISLVGGWVRIAASIPRFWLGYVRTVLPVLKSGGMVVADRWAYGYLVQPESLKFAGPQWLARAVIRLLPQPDHVINLVASPEEIRRRKDELSVSEIEAELELWRRLPVPLVNLDSTEDPFVLAGTFLRDLEL